MEIADIEQVVNSNMQAFTKPHGLVRFGREIRRDAQTFRVRVHGNAAVESLAKWT